MMFDLTTFVGFRSVGFDTAIVDSVLESQALFNYNSFNSRGIIALATIDDSIDDKEIQDLSEGLPEGQYLWIFSPSSRPIAGSRIFRSTHVPSANRREFQLKIGSHIARFIMKLPIGTPLSPIRDSFPTMQIHFGDNDEYLPIFNKRHVVRKMISEVPFDFFSDLRSESKKLVIFGQDAISRSRTELPYFFRWKWANRVKASVVILSDPTLYLDSTLDGAWWIGSRERDYVTEFLEIVKKIVAAQGIRNEDVVFVGMSAGGFSALQMATLLPGAKAIVDIPRVTLRALGARGKTADLAVQKCLGFPSAFEVPTEYSERIDVLSRIVKEKNLPDFIYLQNSLDSKHYETQYGYFKREIQKLPQFDKMKHQFVEYSQWNLTKGGHFALKESVMVRILNDFLENNLILPKVLSKEDITAD